MTAAAVLRCILDERPLASPDWIDSVAEGAMLLAGPVDLDRRVKQFHMPSPERARLF